MSMTREEKITNLEKLAALFYTESEQSKMVDYSKIIETLEFAAAALRPVSREQITKIWPGCDACEIPCNNCESIYAWDRYGKPQECTGCPENGYKNYTPELQFCEFCGRPLTDEAMEMVIERMEALYETDLI